MTISSKFKKKYLKQLASEHVRFVHSTQGLQPRPRSAAARSQLAILFISNQEQETKRSVMGFAIARSYLVLYNTVQAAGWAIALYQSLLALGDAGGYRQVYKQSNTVVSRRGSVGLCPVLGVTRSAPSVRLQGYFSFCLHWKLCMLQQV